MNFYFSRLNLIILTKIITIQIDRLQILTKTETKILFFIDNRDLYILITRAHKMCCKTRVKKKIII